MGSPVGRRDRRRLAAWVVALGAGASWAAFALHGSWFFYDEWSMIDRVIHHGVLDGAFTAFNGHLWVLQYFVVRTQVSWFGIDSHLFVSAVLVGSLTSLHACIAALLRAARVPTVSSLLLGGLVTYLGVAAQNIVFAIQSSPAVAMALCIGAAAIVVARAPSRLTMSVVAASLVAAVFVDSGIALMGLVLGGIVTFGRWPTRRALVSAGPALAIELAWVILGHHGPSWPGTLGERAAFASALLLRTTGGLIGMGETAGVVLLLAATTVVIVGVRRRALGDSSRILWLAGMAAALVTIAAIAHTRAGLVKQDFSGFNRYLGDVAIPLVIAFAPAVTDTLRSLVGGRAIWARSRWVASLPALLLLLTFLQGVPPMRAYQRTFHGWNVIVHERALAAALVLRQGCPPGRALRPRSLPAGSLSPQMTTELLRLLIERHEFTDVREGRAPAALVDTMCTPYQDRSRPD